MMKSKNQGFTIIEVLIVLVIAAIILLIVFLAVPALQRNSRNDGRDNDASRIVSAVTECVSIQGQLSACDQAEVQDIAGNLNQLTTITVNAFSAGTTSSANVVHGFKCTSSTGWTNTNAASTGFIVLYQKESAGGDVQRCLNG